MPDLLDLVLGPDSAPHTELVDGTVEVLRAVLLVPDPVQLATGPYSIL